MLKELGKRIVLLDGAMGTQLQARGLAPGELPETWNLTRPEDVQAIHEAYLAAGATSRARRWPVRSRAAARRPLSAPRSARPRTGSSPAPRCRTWPGP